MLQGQADVVEAVEQAVFAELVHLEGDHLAARGGDGLRLQIHTQAVAFAGLYFLEQAVHRLLVEDDRQDAVLETVVEEDIRKARRDDDAKAIVEQCPRRVLTRGTAAKVLARQQNTRTLEARLVKHEVRIQRSVAVVLARFAVVEVAPLVKQVGAKAATLDGLQKLLGDDSIGVHVSAVHGCHDAGDLFEFFHDISQIFFTAKVAKEREGQKNKVFYFAFLCALCG